MPKPVYPKVLTKDKWDKEKGIIAKMVKKETGLGAKLAELETKFNALPFDKLERTDYQKCTNASECNTTLKTRRDGASEGISAFVPFPKGVAELATKTAEELKKNPLVPKATIEFLKGIPAATTKLSEEIANYVAELLTAQDFAIKVRLKAIEQEAAAASQEAKKFEAQIKKIGEDYIQNRKLALTQMQGLKTLALESSTRIASIAATVDKTAKAPLGSPEAAKKAFADLHKLEADAKSIFTNFETRWLNDGAVEKNPVQRDARGNIGKIDGKPELQPFIDAFQRQSNGIFNTIMANVADIIATKRAIEDTLAAIATDIAIVEDIVVGSSKTLAEHQKTAKEIAAAAHGAAEQGKIIHNKMAAQQGSVNGLVAQAKADSEKVATSHNYIVTTIGELERRVTEFTGTAARILNSARRISVLAPYIQNDPQVKASMKEVGDAHHGFLAAIESLKKMLVNAKAVQSQLPPNT